MRATKRRGQEGRRHVWPAKSCSCSWGNSKRRAGQEARRHLWPTKSFSCSWGNSRCSPDRGPTDRVSTLGSRARKSYTKQVESPPF